MRRLFLKRFLLVISSLILLAACDLTNDQPAVRDSPTLLQDVRELIKRHSLYDVSDKELTIGAAKGMVEAQKDPYSHYFSAEETIIQQSRLAKERIGIGIQLFQQGDRYTITDVVAGTSAAEEGIQAGDELLAIDSKSLKGVPLEGIIQLLAGREGTTVRLTLLSKQNQEQREVVVERRKLPQQTIQASTFEKNNKLIGYIQITVFGEGTAKEWEEQLSLFLEKKLDGLIIDVRGNPGGYLGSVVPILEDVTTQSTPLLWMENAKGELEWIKSEQPATYTGPLVVLHDTQSASASEVLVAALVETDRALSIGRKTYGKGTVQETFEFENKSSLKLTTKKWLTPHKHWIHGKGIIPTIEIKQPSLSEIQQIPATTQEWQTVYTVLELMGYTKTTTSSNPVLIFQNEKGLSPTGQVDSEFINEVRVSYKKWLQKENNDEAIRLALDYFSQSQ